MEPVKQQNPNKTPADDGGVPIYELYFCVGYRNPDLPVEGLNGGTGRLRARKSLTITYYGRLHEFRVDESTNGKRKPPCFIPASWAARVPLVDQELQP